MLAHARVAVVKKPTCLFCGKDVYARGLCPGHYQKARRMKLPPDQVIRLAGLPDKKESASIRLSPRVTPSTYERLQKAVARGRASSVYVLLHQILEEWRDVDHDRKK